MSLAETNASADGGSLLRGVASGLSLAATPAFGAMAMITSVFEHGRVEMVCSIGPDASPLTGMAGMYLLMSALHLGPWLKLIADRRRA